MRSLQGCRASSVCSLIKDAQIQTRGTSPTRTRQWNEAWRELSVEMFELRRGQEGDVCVCVCVCIFSSAEVFSVKMRCLYQPSPLLLQASACVTLIVFASHAKYLLFPSTFCRQALVPQLLFFLCLFKKRELRKRKMCFPSATTVPLAPPQTPAVAHFRRVSELWGENQENKAHEHNC